MRSSPTSGPASSAGDEPGLGLGHRRQVGVDVRDRRALREREAAERHAAGDLEDAGGAGLGERGVGAEIAGLEVAHAELGARDRRQPRDLGGDAIGTEKELGGAPGERQAGLRPASRAGHAPTG